METLKKIIIGLVAGLVSGLFSAAGWLILVPSFMYVLKLDTKKSRATSITCILPMVLATSLFYAKNNYIEWKLAIFCAIGGAIGSFVGSKKLKKIPDCVLKISFAIFLFYVGFYMIKK